MEQNDFKNEKTGLCKFFNPRENRKLIVNTMDTAMYDHYSSCSCYKGNIYCEYAEYCAKDLCLYYKPTVQLSTPDHAGIIILDAEDKK